MNIGLFTPNYPGLTREGGIGTYTRHLAHALTAQGHEVCVLTPGPADRTTQDGPVSVRLVRPHYLPVVERVVPGSGACCHIAAAMLALVRRHRLEVVEFPNWEGTGTAFCLLRRVPVVVRLHTSSREALEIDGTATSRLARWDIAREAWQVRLADAVVTHSEAHRARMAAELGIDRASITVLPHGVPVVPAFRRERRCPEPTVVFLGRLERRKGTLDLLHAIPADLRAVPAARFVLIGTDRPHCPGGRTHAEYLRDEFPPEVRAHVQLAGRLADEEVNAWLQRADLFVAPSLYESFGLIFLEAMRWGTPVIGTTAGGIPEVVRHGESGLLVPPECPAELAAAMVRILRDEDLRERLGTAGRRRAETVFSIELTARRVADFYATVVRQWRPGRLKGSETTTRRPDFVPGAPCRGSALQTAPR